MYQTSVQIFGYATPVLLMEIYFIIIIIIIIITGINTHLPCLMFIKYRSLKLCKVRILLFLKMYILHAMYRVLYNTTFVSFEIFNHQCSCKNLLFVLCDQSDDGNRH